jgi:uncharacterized protein YabE (DUF348 family)
MRIKLHKLIARLNRTYKIRLFRLRRSKWRHPIIVPIVTFLVLTLISVTAFLVINGGSSKFKPINSYIAIISYDHVQETVPTHEHTVRALLRKLGLTLNQGDVVEPSLNTPITEDNFRINIYRAVPVEIVEGTTKTFTFSAATTPRSIVEQAGVKIYPEDYVTTIPTQNFIKTGAVGEEVLINPATPVNVNIYGTPSVLRTHATTVGALLADSNIKLGQGDSVQPSVTTPLTTGLQVFLIHSGTQIKTVQQTIAMPTQTIQDDSLTFGTSAVRQQGSPGQEVLTYQENLQNGVVVSQTLIQTVVTQQPVTDIIAEGDFVLIPSEYDTVMADAGISSTDYAYVNYIVSNESGWCPTKIQGELGACPDAAPADGVPDYGGYGLGQATPGDKMASFGADWETDPVTQLRWANAYALATYGSWEAAYNHKVAYGWW